MLEPLEHRLAPSTTALNNSLTAVGAAQKSGVLVTAAPNHPIQANGDIPVVSVSPPPSASPPIALILVDTPPTQVPPDRTFIALPVETVATKPVQTPIGNVLNQTGAVEPPQPEPNNGVVPAAVPPDKSRSDKAVESITVSVTHVEPKPIARPRSAFHPEPLTEMGDQQATPATPQMRGATAPYAPLPLFVWVVGMTWLLMLRWHKPVGESSSLRDTPQASRSLFFLLELHRIREDDRERPRPR
jgi:hypothetical protein